MEKIYVTWDEIYANGWQDFYDEKTWEEDEDGIGCLIPDMTGDGKISNEDFTLTPDQPLRPSQQQTGG